MQFLLEMELFDVGCTELSLHSMSHWLFLLVLIPGLRSSNFICTHVLLVLVHGFLNYKYLYSIWSIILANIHCIASIYLLSII